MRKFQIIDIFTLLKNLHMSIQEGKVLPYKGNENLEQTLKVDAAKGKIHCQVRMFYIQDGEHMVAYIPALELTGYGKNKEDAKKMVDIIINDLFENLMKLSPAVMRNELLKLGWNVSRIFKKKFNNKTFIDKEGVLRNFELPKDTKIEEASLQMA